MHQRRLSRAGRFCRRGGVTPYTRADRFACKGGSGRTMTAMGTFMFFYKSKHNLTNNEQAGIQVHLANINAHASFTTRKWILTLKKFSSGTFGFALQIDQLEYNKPGGYSEQLNVPADLNATQTFLNSQTQAINGIKNFELRLRWSLSTSCRPDEGEAGINSFKFQSFRDFGTPAEGAEYP